MDLEPDDEDAVVVQETTKGLTAGGLTGGGLTAGGHWTPAASPPW